MRPLTEILDVDAMQWQPLGSSPGLYSKLLNRDPETGARTALQRMVPADGYKSPAVAHYHHTYEEIIGIKGCFSFDSKRWIRPLSYVFHPPLSVHGFKSSVPEESWFLSRVEHDLDFNFVEAPTHDDIYPVNGAPPARAIVALSDPLTERGTTSVHWADSATPVEWCDLSKHPHTGEGSALVRLPAAWSANAAEALQHKYLEIFVIEGSLELDGKGMRRHFYTYRPEGTFPERMSSAEGALIYVNFGPTQ